MNYRLSLHTPRAHGGWLLRGCALFICAAFLCSITRAQSGVVTFEESKWSPVIGTKLYHGGPSNTLTDSDFGVSFIIAYGEMAVTSMGYHLNSLFYSPIITSNGTTDVSGMVIIRFTNAKEHVRLKVSHDEHPVHTPDYLKVSFYGGTGATNLLYYETVPWNAGAYTSVAYDNSVTGIREVVVNSMYAENNIDNIEFVQLGTSNAFDDGTLQGWTTQGALDETGGGPFSSHFITIWKDDIDFPSPPGQAAAGDSRGSMYMGCTSGHGITGSSGTWWIMQLTSPDLSSSTAWQTATGYTVQIANCMGPSAVYANLYVKVYDKIQAKNRWFYSGTAQQLLHDTYGDATAVWNYLTFDWSSISTFPTSYTIKEVFVDIWGTMAGSYEGGVALDAVTPIYDIPVAIQLASFEAAVAAGQQVHLKWKTLSEVDNYGFEVQRKRSSDEEFVTLEGSFISGHGTTTEPQEYEYTDATAGPGTWLYRLKQIDMQGTVSYSSTVVVNVPLTTLGDGAARETAFALMQNYPNPFNPKTVISCQLPVASVVRLVVYDVLGREVKILMDEKKEAGRHDVTWDAGGCASGLYICRMVAGEFVQSRTMILMR